MSGACVFCEIAAGRIPCARICEDKDTLAFLDAGPVIKGHTLVVPRRHVPSLPEAPEELLAPLFAAVRRVAALQIERLGADGVNVMQNNGAAAGQVVPHLHVHVIPRFSDDGHSWNWKAGQYRDAEEMQEWALRLRGGATAPDGPRTESDG